MAEIDLTILVGSMSPTPDVDEFLTSMEAYAALGVSQVWISAPAPDPVGWVESFTAAVVPRLSEI
jgi:hypothetical protein